MARAGLSGEGELDKAEPYLTKASECRRDGGVVGVGEGLPDSEQVGQAEKMWHRRSSRRAMRRRNRCWMRRRRRRFGGIETVGGGVAPEVQQGWRAMNQGTRSKAASCSGGDQEESERWRCA